MSQMTQPTVSKQWRK